MRVGPLPGGALELATGQRVALVAAGQGEANGGEGAPGSTPAAGVAGAMPEGGFAGGFAGGGPSVGARPARASASRCSGTRSRWSVTIWPISSDVVAAGCAAR